MGYEPRLIINASSLQKQAPIIENEHYSEQDNRALKYVYDILQDVNKNGALNLCGFLLVTRQPEGSVFNKEVREVLTDFEIEYVEEN